MKRSYILLITVLFISLSFFSFEVQQPSEVFYKNDNTVNHVRVMLIFNPDDNAVDREVKRSRLKRNLNARNIYLLEKCSSRNTNAEIVEIVSDIIIGPTRDNPYGGDDDQEAGPRPQMSIHEFSNSVTNSGILSFSFNLECADLNHFIRIE